MLPDLPKPLYTVVDEADLGLTYHWGRVGFTTRRREWEYPDPRTTGLGSVLPPSGVTVVAIGEAEEAVCATLDRVIRDEVEATVGWREIPAEVLVRPGGVALDLSEYAAAESGRYVGQARVVQVARQPRIGLIAVRADRHRCGTARALLAHVLGAPLHSGVGAPLSSPRRVDHGYVHGIHSSPNGEMREIWQ
jgi:hypothetical protein